MKHALRKKRKMIRRSPFFCINFLYFLLAACASSTPDPWESTNREIFKFNRAFDATMIRPTARVYHAILPPFVQAGIHNAFSNIQMIPTIVNDFLQAEGKQTIRDSWRFFINSTFGVLGLFDVASSSFGLPPHYNDFGITFAKWGFIQSPYMMIPFLGPTTFRDGFGTLIDFSILSPYPYFITTEVIYAVGGVRYMDVRSQLLDTDPLIGQAIDPYLFVREAYLQHRAYLIQGEGQNEVDSPSGASESEVPAGYVEE